MVRSTPNAHVASPIELSLPTRQIQRPELRVPRIRIEAGRGSRLAVRFDQSCAAIGGLRFTNAIIEVDIAENAQVELTLLQRETGAAYSASNTAVRLPRDARFTSRVVTLGGRLVRNDLSVVLAGEGAECALDGLYLGTGERVVDNHSLVDHAVPHCTSRQLYKGVLGGSSQGVFRGRVVVRPSIDFRFHRVVGGRIYFLSMEGSERVEPEIQDNES